LGIKKPLALWEFNGMKAVKRWVFRKDTVSQWVFKSANSLSKINRV
jgi:hypothetical protein